MLGLNSRLIERSIGLAINIKKERKIEN